MDYAISVDLVASFEDVEAKVRELLANEGFGILTEIDVKATMKKKLDIDKPKYMILGACNPPRANRVLDAVQDIGLLLPCNVVVYENSKGSITCSATNPAPFFNSIDNPVVKEVGNEVAEIMQKVIENLKNTF